MVLQLLNQITLSLLKLIPLEDMEEYVNITFVAHFWFLLSLCVFHCLLVFYALINMV